MRRDQDSGGRRLQFTIRTALLAMLLVALAFGWYKSVVVAHRRNEELSWRLMRAQSEIQNARSRAEVDEKLKGRMSGKGGLSGVCLDGVNLRGISISGGLFQVSSFKTPPLYDGKTLFPNGFDPQARGWTRAK